MNRTNFIWFNLNSGILSADWQNRFCLYSFPGDNWYSRSVPRCFLITLLSGCMEERGGISWGSRSIILCGETGGRIKTCSKEQKWMNWAYRPLTELIQCMSSYCQWLHFGQFCILRMYDWENNSDFQLGSSSFWQFTMLLFPAKFSSSLPL